MTDVICPADKGTLSQEACLRCALTWENKCGYDYGVLSAMFQKPDRSGIHVTDLTGCLRRAYYNKTTPIPVPVHSLLVMFSGTAMHAAFEQNCDTTSDCELELDAEGIVGKADRVYKDGTLVDYKTTRWIIPSRLPYSSHQLQLQIYAHLLRKMNIPVKRAFVQYVDMFGPTRCQAGPKGSKCKGLVEYRDGNYLCPKCGKEFPEGHLGAYRVEVNIKKNIREVMMKSRDALSTAIETKIPPYPERGWLCSYCQYKSICEADGG